MPLNLLPFLLTSLTLSMSGFCFRLTLVVTTSKGMVDIKLNGFGDGAPNALCQVVVLLADVSDNTVLVGGVLNMTEFVGCSITEKQSNTCERNANNAVLTMI